MKIFGIPVIIDSAVPPEIWGVIGDFSKICPNWEKHSIIERCADCGYSVNDEDGDWDGDTPETASRF
jgi:hypothetical protein